MPRFDGTGPEGGGPMTGRGEGYCILELPESDWPARGYAGLEGARVHVKDAPPNRKGVHARVAAPVAWPARWLPTAAPRARRVPSFGCRRGRAGGRGRGRCLPRW
jgi:hypothetical protein